MKISSYLEEKSGFGLICWHKVWPLSQGPGRASVSTCSVDEDLPFGRNPDDRAASLSAPGKN